MAEKKKQSSTSFVYSALLLVVVLALTLGFMLSHKRKKTDIYEPTIAAVDQNPEEAKPRSVMRTSAHVRHDAGDVGGAGLGGTREPLSQPAHRIADTERSSLSGGGEEDLVEAMKLVDGGQPKEALVLLEKILKEDPYHEMALVEAGMIHLIDFKDSNASTEFLERALGVNPNNSIVLSELAGVYEETGKIEEGLNYMQGLYDKHPDSAALPMAIGQVYANEDRMPEAINFMEKAVEAEKQKASLANTSVNTSYVTALGDAYAVVGKNDKALEYYSYVVEDERKKLAEDPIRSKDKLVNAQMDVAGQYLQQNEIEKAKEIIMNEIRPLMPADQEGITAMLENYTASKL